MTEKQIESLFKVWQKRLGLDLWDIKIHFEDIEPDTTIMQIHRSVQYDRATIKVQPWMITNKPPKDWNCGRKVTNLDVEDAVVHELLHCHIGQLWIWSTLLDNYLHNDVLSIARDSFDRLEERIVDRLAVSIVKAYK